MSDRPASERVRAVRRDRRLLHVGFITVFEDVPYFFIMFYGSGRSQLARGTPIAPSPALVRH
ncbi:MAG TPA: hypothetical protein VJ724_02885 [Tahibacter sp.]|nr:hypothetical protein [Tahibacter sp.]